MSEFLNNRIVADLIQQTINYPLPVDKQRSCAIEGDVWVSDWWTIELLKRLYIGEDRYLTDLPALRIINNSNFNLKQIKKDGDIIISTLEKLKRSEISGAANQILVCNVERGLDILAAVIARQWDMIYCFDPNNGYADFLLRIFSEQHSIKITFFNSSMENFDFSILKENTIAIANFVEAKKIDIKPLILNAKILYTIRDGELG